MTSSTRASISALPRGHEFPASTFTLSRETTDAYLRATGDRGAYGDAIPPLAAIALGLNALQERLSLPEGSLHTGQEVEHERITRVGDVLTVTGRIAQRSERQGFVISVIEFEIASPAGTALRARTTIMAPGTAA